MEKLQVLKKPSLLCLQNDYRLVRQRKESIMHVLSKSLSNRYIIMHLNLKYHYLMLLIAPNLRPYGFSVLIFILVFLRVKHDLRH
jgi:hypothetical protein